MSKSFRLPLKVFLVTFSLLAVVQVKVERPMILGGPVYIKDKFFSMNHNKARNLYLLLTTSLHAACIALARI